MIPNIKIEKHKKGDPLPYDLFLIADPSKKAIDTYISDSLIYGGYFNNELISCYALYPVDENTNEIKNIVVAEKYEGKGIGTILLKDAIERSVLDGKKKLIVCTGNSSAGPLHLYQKVGFKITGVKKDFFIENYTEPIFEDGVQCRDMIILSMDL